MSAALSIEVTDSRSRRRLFLNKEMLINDIIRLIPKIVKSYEIFLIKERCREWPAVCNLI
jgi:hypothetical protein